MKNSFFSSMILMLLVLFGTGCVRYKITVATPDGTQKTVTKKAAELTPQEAHMVLSAKQIHWKTRLGLFCPVGGYDNVVIEPRLGDESRWLPPTPLKGFLRRTVFVLRATNTEKGEVNIEDTAGLVVRNLCPGGSITLVRSLGGSELGSFGVQTTHNSYDFSLDVFWFASGVTTANKFGRIQSPRGVLYTYASRQRQDEGWSIRLVDENGRFF